MLQRFLVLFVILTLPFISAGQAAQSTLFDVLIKGGDVYDGAGGRPRHADVGIRGDRIAAIAPVVRERRGMNATIAALLT